MDAKLNQRAREILEKRGYLRMIDGKRETVTEWVARIARGVARYADKAMQSELEAATIAMMNDLRFIPNTPCLMNADTPMGQLAACFVLPIQDDMGGEDAGIFATLRNAALIQQTGGGVGFDWSALRPEGDLVASSGGKASGPISFLRIYDTAFGGIAQGGSRRGANMAVMRVDHPDIEKFIACKRGSESALTNFNISVALTEKFMKALSVDGTFDLVNPKGGAVVRSVKAAGIMRIIAENAHANGEPGVLFIDRINEDNPVPDLYTIAATNPCGEQALGPYESCCLGHVNLARHCYDKGVMDWAKLDETTRFAVKFLDTVISANKFVPGVPQLQRAALATRRIGLGITGLADVFMRAGMAYGDELSELYAEIIMMRIRYVAMSTSADLAAALSPYPAMKREHIVCPKFDAGCADLGSRVSRICAPIRECEALCAMMHEGLRFGSEGELRAKIEKHGMRNACLLSVAPTGTTSLILGVDGSGCEPVFSLSYSRTTQERTMRICSDLARELIETYCPDKARAESLLQDIARDGMLTEASVAESRGSFAKYLAALRATALNVSPGAHLNIQAALQRWVDNSISKTINCPKETTVEDISAMYLHAWQKGLKGVAIYRTGSRDKEVLVATAAVPAAAPAMVPAEVVPRKKRPSLVSGFTHKCETSFGHVFTTVNLDGMDAERNPFEVFVTVGKSGTEAQADSEAIGRLISFVLRLNSGVPVRERMEIVINQLRDIGGSRSHRDSSNKKMIRSIPDAVAVSLEEIMTRILGEASAKQELSVSPRHTVTLYDICPRCHKMTLIRSERCSHCESCPYSAC
jgi:ribonucleoside-diphosphate reductase alpha chain